MSKPTTGKWQAWDNIMPVQPTPGGTLHVTGEADTHSSDFALLKKTVPQGVNPKILMLTMIVERGFVPATNPQQLHYTEELAEVGQYKAIDILFEGKIIASINKIEIVQ